MRNLFEDISKVNEEGFYFTNDDTTQFRDDIILLRKLISSLACHMKASKTSITQYNEYLEACLAHTL